MIQAVAYGKESFCWTILFIERKRTLRTVRLFAMVRGTIVEPGSSVTDAPCEHGFDGWVGERDVQKVGVCFGDSEVARGSVVCGQIVFVDI